MRLPIDVTELLKIVNRLVKMEDRTVTISEGWYRQFCVHHRVSMNRMKETRTCDGINSGDYKFVREFSTYLKMWLSMAALIHQEFTMWANLLLT